MLWNNCNLNNEREAKNVLEDISACTGCYACYNVCSVQAIKMVSNSEGFFYPEIDSEKCIGCGHCKEVCPVLNKPEAGTKTVAFAAYAKEDTEHRSSSSGGVFAVLARTVLKNGGAVCGAAFDSRLQLKHILVESEEDLMKLKGTKYVQSEIGTVFQEIKKFLLSGRQVLFSGTPCQAAGLKAFLTRDYENLLCVDLICHGVPSQKVFSRYLEELSDTSITEVNFRNKSSGISNIMLTYETVDGGSIREVYGESPYMMGFIENLFIRPSCFCCNFKGEMRASDITIGDFWGIQEFHPGFGTDQGTSAVIIHSARGLQAFEMARNKMIVEPASVDEIKAWNSCLVESISYNPRREDFFDIWRDMPVQDAVKKLCIDKKMKKRKLYQTVKDKISRWLV